ncbi:hypothetical protein AGMMS49983_13860 [Clostridia bacterium]|nr:hypothetical protein AGMMS49983_13860 [Clostridia bacterium]
MERALEYEWAFVAEKRAYPDSVKWFCACCAVVQISGQQNPAIFGGAYKTPDDVAGWREVLYNSWQINNKNHLLTMLPKLLDGRAVTIYMAQRLVLDGADLQEAMERFAGNFSEDDLPALEQGVLAAGHADGNKDSDEWEIFDAIANNGGERCMWLTPGEHTLGLTYRWDKLSLFGKLTPYENANRTVQGKNAEKRVVMEANGEYTLFYDIEGETYCLTAEDDGERTKHGKGM